MPEYPFSVAIWSGVHPRFPGNSRWHLEFLGDQRQGQGRQEGSILGVDIRTAFEQRQYSVGAPVFGQGVQWSPAHDASEFRIRTVLQ